ncbi:MAG TPA: hypothetical protein PKC87_05335, partial [Candidatus Absconditabacterales bacterium]|nr:hypothetical protein [Candidatus Absconditabacterales bacterium]
DVYMLKDILKKLHKKEGQVTMKDLAIDGSDIIKQFKLIPGPIVGTLLKKTMARVISDITTRNDKKQIFGFIGIQLKHMKTMKN